MALEKTPGMKPCMAIAITQDQQVVGRMLAVIVTRRWFLPPISLRYGHVYGEGCYAPNADTSRIFGLLLMAVTNKFKHELCLFAEFSNISKRCLATDSFANRDMYQYRGKRFIILCTACRQKTGSQNANCNR